MTAHKTPSTKRVSWLRNGLCNALSVGIIVSALSSCTSTDELAQLKKEQDSLKIGQAALQNEIAQLKTQLATEMTKPPIPVAAAKSVPLTFSNADNTFTDTNDVFGATEISDLAKWHIFESRAGKFEPHKPLTRGEFARWLVRAENSYHCKDRPSCKIRMPEDSAPSFPDVPVSNPDFKYIQALSDAGYAVGFDDKTFKPEEIITREQMIGMKVAVDLGKEPAKADFATAQSNHPNFKDLNKLSPRYFGAFSEDRSNWTRSDNLGRLCGSTTILKPQAPVTRAEAAVCLWKIGCCTTTVVSADIAP